MAASGWSLREHYRSLDPPGTNWPPPHVLSRTPSTIGRLAQHGRLAAWQGALNILRDRDARLKTPAMDNVIRSLLVFVVCLFPVAVALLVIRRKRRAWSAKSKLPFEELRRRPAGESLRLKLEALDEKIAERISFFAAVPVLLALASYYQRSPGAVFFAETFLLSITYASVFGWSFYRLLRERANYQLGFDGERFVGEELTRLVAVGFEVYHDLPFDGFNMDHVVVGSPGVFLVETKARRKPVKDTGGKEYRVVFDGVRLHWPWGADDYGVQQAANNARTLAGWLSGAVGESVAVTPILALPGWLVDRKAPSPNVCVVNPKEIIKVCNTEQERLNENLIRRICYQLDQKCKLDLGSGAERQGQRN